MPIKGRDRLTIGLLIHNLSGGYYESIWTAVAKRAEERDCDLLIISADRVNSDFYGDAVQDDGLSALQASLINERTVDGLVVSATAVAQSDRERVKAFFDALPVPVASFNERIGGHPAVLVDNRGGTRDLVRHLALEHGKKRIAYVSGAETHRESAERFDAYKLALEELGLGFDPALHRAGTFLAASGAAGLEALLAETDPDAIVFANDAMALAALSYAAELGVDVPGRLAIAGFDDVPEAAESEPSLCTVRQPSGEIAVEAFDMLLDGLRTGRPAASKRFPTSLIPRESCGCPAPRSPGWGLPLAERHAALAKLNAFFQDLSAPLNRKEAAERAERGFKVLGLRAAALSLFEGPPDPLDAGETRLSLAMAYDLDAPGEAPRPGTGHALRDLGPEGLLPDDRRWTRTISLLAAPGQPVALLQMDARPERGPAYDGLRLQLLGTLRSILLIEAKEAAERKLAEANAGLERGNRALERYDLLKTEFMANLSAELRTPLTLVMGPLESIIAGEYGRDVPASSKVFQTMLRNSRSMLRTITAFLDFSRLETQRRALERARESVSDLVRYYLSSAHSEARARKLELSFEDSTGGLEAAVDRDLFEKAFFCLLNNAFKHTPAGGSVRVRLRAAAGGRFELEIEDTGVGIPQGRLAQLFERFAEQGDALPQAWTGSGMGLLLVKSVAGMHGGELTARSEVNRGSSFTLSMPVGELESLPRGKSPAEAPGSGVEAAPAAEEGEGAGHDAGKLNTILLAEDNDDMAAFLRGLLGREYRLVRARSAEEAVALAEAEQADLVVADLSAPARAGPELARRLKATPGTAACAVMILASDADPESRIMGYEGGADDYVVKPFNYRELLARIRTSVEMKNLRDKLAVKNQVLEEVVRLQVLAIEQEKNTAVGQRRKAERQLEGFLLVLGSAIESKDLYTGGHVERVAEYSRDIARAMGLDPARVTDIYLGAIVHDVGKIGVPDSLLKKEGQLTEEEWLEMKRHPDIGKKLLERIESIETAVDIAYSHQERWDGSGYPRGLSGEAIPLAARIVSVADYWDSIVTDRPYRKALELETAKKELRKESAQGLDPAIVELFLDPDRGICGRYAAADGFSPTAAPRGGIIGAQGREAGAGGTP